MDAIEGEKVVANPQFRIGYALNPKKLRKPVNNTDGADSQSEEVSIGSKWAGGGLSDILAQPAPADNLIFQAWDPETPPHKQPFFHVIIHKLTEDIDREESREKIQALQQYLLHWPRTILLDPLSSVRKVISRARTCQHLSAIEQKLKETCPFRQPLHLIVAQNESLPQVKERMVQQGLKLPVICKPVEACGTPRSHEMVVLVSEEDLILLPRPCVMQQYEDHGGWFYKVYVIDEDVSVFRRASLPDLTACVGRTKSLVFDSRRCYPTTEDFLSRCKVSEDQYSGATAKDENRNDDTGTNRSNTNHCNQISNIIPVSSNSQSNSSGLHTVSSRSLDQDSGLWKLQNISSPSSEKRSHHNNTNGTKYSSISDGNTSHSRYANTNSNPTASNSVFSTTSTASMRMEGDNMDSDTQQTLVCAARLIQQEFQLRLFGFDVLLIPSSVHNEIVVVDVNYFPSYKEVVDFPQRLRSLLRRLSVTVATSDHCSLTERDNTGEISSSHINYNNTDNRNTNDIDIKTGMPITVLDMPTPVPVVW